MPVQILKHRFTVQEYHRMAEAGIFSEDDRYRDMQSAERGQRCSMETFPDLIFSVDDVLI